jgi:hypothetical protein
MVPSSAKTAELLWLKLINSGKVSILDWSGVSIVAGGDAYYENYTTVKSEK